MGLHAGGYSLAGICSISLQSYCRIGGVITSRFKVDGKSGKGLVRLAFRRLRSLNITPGTFSDIILIRTSWSLVLACVDSSTSASGDVHILLLRNVVRMWLPSRLQSNIKQYNVLSGYAIAAMI